jgi:hypothetical protein
MNKIMLYIFSKTALGRMVDGKKTIIGAVLIIMSAALQALEKIAPMFPQYPVIKDASEGLSGVFKAIEPMLENLGLGFLTAGIAHKSVKAKLPPAE